RNLGIRYRQRAHLLGREPKRERAREMLDQKSADPLQGTVDGAVDHHGAVRLVVFPRVLEPKPLRPLEVELDRRPLPLAADRIVELHVDLRAVERAAALVEPVGQATPLERLLERTLRLVPRRIGAELLRRTRRQIETVAEPERFAEHQL